MKRFEVVLLTLSLFSTLLFFGYNLIIGRVYAGAASDNSYISFMMVVDIVPLYLFLKYIIKGGNTKNIAPILIVLAVFIVAYGLGVGANDITFKSLVAFTLPAALTGILIAKSNMGSYFAKLLEPFMVFLTITGIVSMRHLLAVSELVAVGEEGVGINSLSYHCGFAFALNLYFLLFGDELPERFKYTKISVYKFFSIALLVVQFVVGLSSGGRGGFILLLVSGIVLVFLRLSKRNARSNKTIVTFLLLITAVIVAVQFMPDNIVEAMTRGSERTFSYIKKGGGIDASATSNRDDVYEDCYEYIAQSPIIGYGLLMKNTPFFGDRPHNVFFEVLLQGGIIYLIVFLWFMIHLFKKMRRLIKHGHGLYMVPIALYPGVMLMFSGTYVSSDLMWFLVSYILCSEIPSNNIVKDKSSI